MNPHDKKAIKNANTITDLEFSPDEVKSEEHKEERGEGEKKGNNKEKCSICLEPLKPAVLQFLGCHTFHRSCIDRWINEGHNSCPLCRKSHGYRPVNSNGAELYHNAELLLDNYGVYNDSIFNNNYTFLRANNEVDDTIFSLLGIGIWISLLGIGTILVVIRRP